MWNSGTHTHTHTVFYIENIFWKGLLETVTSAGDVMGGGGTLASHCTLSMVFEFFKYTL